MWVVIYSNLKSDETGVCGVQGWEYVVGVGAQVRWKNAKFKVDLQATAVKNWFQLRQWLISEEFRQTNRAGIFERVWGPGIDSKEWIPPAYVAWRAGTITLFLLGA